MTAARDSRYHIYTRASSRLYSGSMSVCRLQANRGYLSLSSSFVHACCENMLSPPLHNYSMHLGLPVPDKKTSLKAKSRFVRLLPSPCCSPIFPNHPAMFLLMTFSMRKWGTAAASSIQNSQIVCSNPITGVAQMEICSFQNGLISISLLVQYRRSDARTNATK
jgi:hypothetical protein